MQLAQQGSAAAQEASAAAEEISAQVQQVVGSSQTLADLADGLKQAATRFSSDDGDTQFSGTRNGNAGTKAVPAA